MLPRPAQYLLRFDDLCPTFSRTGWMRFKAIVDEFNLKPILGVIPDNRDSELTVESPDPRFWDEMRSMESSGCAIALHGYRHLCDSPHSGLIPLHRHTEFAGVEEETQRAWIRNGIDILHSHRLSPRLFIAPRHGFDRATLKALKAEGLPYISDGFARAPFVKHGVCWIPQQLWRPVEKQMGLWTICIHPNTSGNSLARSLRSFVEQNAQSFTSLDRVIKEFTIAPLPPAERIYSAIALWRNQLRRQRRRYMRAN